jgi:hypothetical protein
MVARPKHKQPETIRALDLDISKLEDLARESLEGWDGEEVQSENVSKKVILQEIFEVAKADERFQRDASEVTSGDPLEKSTEIMKGAGEMPEAGEKHEVLDSPMPEPLTGH